MPVPILIAVDIDFAHFNSKIRDRAAWLGSKERWQQHYRQMVAEARAAGIELVFAVVTKKERVDDLTVEQVTAFKEFLQEDNPSQFVKQTIRLNYKNYYNTYCLTTELQRDRFGRLQYAKVLNLTEYDEDLPRSLRARVPWQIPVPASISAATPHVVVLDPDPSVRKSPAILNIARVYGIAAKDVIFFDDTPAVLDDVRGAGCKTVSAEAFHPYRYPVRSGTVDYSALHLGYSESRLEELSDEAYVNSQLDRIEADFMSTLRTNIYSRLHDKLRAIDLTSVRTELFGLRDATDEVLVAEIFEEKKARFLRTLASKQHEIDTFKRKIATLESYYRERSEPLPGELIGLQTAITAKETERSELSDTLISIGDRYQRLYQTRLRGRAYAAIQTILADPDWSGCVNWCGGERLADKRVVPAGIAAMSRVPKLDDGVDVTIADLNQFIDLAEESNTRGNSRIYSFFGLRDQRVQQFYNLVADLESDRMAISDVTRLERFLHVDDPGEGAALLLH